MPNLASVVNFFSTPNEGFATTLGSTISSGAVTVPLAGTSGLTNGSIFVGIIEPGATNQQVFTGIVDTGGSQITSVVWTRGSNNSHLGGVAIVDYVTGTAFGMISKGILVEHNQSGTHGAITSTNAVLTTPSLISPTTKGTVDGWIGANESWTYASSTTITVPTDATTKYDIGDYVKLTQSATVKYFRISSLTSTVLTVTPLNGTDTVANSTITSNAYSKVQSPHGVSPTWVTFTPTWTGITPGNGVNTIAEYCQIGKTVFVRGIFTGGTTSSGTGVSPTLSLPVTSSSAYGASNSPLGLFRYAASSLVSGYVRWASTTTVTMVCYAVSGANLIDANLPIAFASTYTLAYNFSYEAA